MFQGCAILETDSIVKYNCILLSASPCMLHVQPITSFLLGFLTLCRCQIACTDRSCFQSTFFVLYVRRQILFLVWLCQYPGILLHLGFYIYLMLRESNCQLNWTGCSGKTVWATVTRPIHICVLLTGGNPSDHLILEREWAKISSRNFPNDLRDSRVWMSTKWHGCTLF
jgi:hypothetical protein